MMRTRILNKMRNCEVEEYLDRGGDTVLVPVGTVEMHGDLPLDCETVWAEAFAKLLAEEMDALTLVHLPYFYPGATRVGRGTVYVSIADGAAYLRSLSDSLYRQGFHKQIFLTGHGPAYLTVNSFLMDAFHTDARACLHISLMNAFQIARQNGWQCEGFPMKPMMYGAYKIMGQLDDLYVDPEAVCSDALPGGGGEFHEAVARLNSLATAPGNVGFYYPEYRDHGGGEGCRSVAERDALADRGEQLLRQMVQYLHADQIKKDLSVVERRVREEILPQFPHIRKDAEIPTQGEESR